MSAAVDNISPSASIPSTSSSSSSSAVFTHVLPSRSPSPSYSRTRSPSPENDAVCLEWSSERREVTLFYAKEAEDLARQVAAQSGDIQLGAINWGQFQDGFPNLFIPDATRIRNRHVAFLASFHSPPVIFEQLSVIYALPRMFVRSFSLVLPFFPTGTVERMEDEGDIATAYTLARLLSKVPLSRGGPTSVVIFDIHALQERFYFGDDVLPVFESGIPLLKRELRRLPDADRITIAYPDEGAWKRFNKQFGDFPEVICTKVRDGDKRLVQLKEGDPRGRHVVIVDDLVQSGGTLIECQASTQRGMLCRCACVQKLLTAVGAAEVSAYATHGVFPNQSWRRFARGNKEGVSFKRFWMTDSCPIIAREVAGQEPFEVISLASAIAAALQI
eukprot:jgi/Chlat1/7544/Chrsp62S07034